MNSTEPLLYLALWLLLGVIADKLCEWQAKKEGKPYDRVTAVACYLFGAVVIPIALASAIIKVVFHMFRPRR